MSRDRPRLKRAAAARDLVQALLRSHGWEGKIEECRAWLAWDEVVGPQIAAHARPVRVREGVLEVRVDQPVWMQQLQLLKPQILARLNSHYGRTVLRDIFWRRGKVDRDTAPPAISDGVRWRPVPLSGEEETVIREALTPLADPDLRQGLNRILIRQMQLAKLRRERKG